MVNNMPCQRSNFGKVALRCPLPLRFFSKTTRKVLSSHRHLSLLSLFLLVACPVLRSQQQRDVTDRKSPRGARDIVSDNMDRVAATAEQILEALNKDPGLMVEYKRVLAQDAGDSGQILEESDLGDAAINERLHQDLRTRVLATRLLRRFGYLLPRFNPGSDPAAEHDLTLRERAQTILSAAERSSNAQQE